MNIAVVRALQLGDLLCAVPALRALRTAYPAARIALVGLAWAREFAVRFRRYIDAFIEFPGFPGMPERPCAEDELDRFLAQMRGRRFDLALQMHGSGEVTNPLTVRMGAAAIAGSYRDGQYCPDRSRFIAWQEHEHEVLRWLRLLTRLGIAARGPQLEFPLGAEDRAEATALGLHNYVCLHPGSQLPSRRWPAERFAEVGDALAARGYNVVLTGSAAEAPLTREVARAMRARPRDLAGRTSLGGVAAVIAGARLLVSNDTGVSHIAAATRTASVVVCCGADPRRWAPLDRVRHRVLHSDVACRPCSHVQCPIGHPCALQVSASEVIDRTVEVLACA
jgi:ADP-heptose:LPS heptosyltransferase